MQDKGKQKLLLKKSSIELEDSQDTKQEIIQTEEQKMSNKKPNMENLLDLDETFLEKRKQYESFLQDRQIVIEGPELVTENVIKSYKLYKIKSRKKGEQQFDTCVSRRFSDFEYLQKQLVDLYGGCIIPLLPQKNIWANVNMEGKEQIANRVAGLQKYLKSLLSHAKLKVSQEVRNFLFENQIKFSQKKGQYFSKVRTQQKLKQIASNAYTIGKGLVSRFITGSQPKQEQQTRVIKPSIEDVRLMQYQREVSDLIKVINVLRKVVENSVLQMSTIGILLPESKQSQFQCMSILHKFEDLCKYIFSCNQALVRRHQVRLQIDQLNLEYQSLQKKIKSNPRSQQVDMLRNKIAKSTQKCDKWTNCLLQQLQQSISVGKSMVESFIGEYTVKKQQFYAL